VSDKFELQYTCKVCETRNAHRVSRIGKLIEFADKKCTLMSVHKY
jgi:ribosomal protein L44E